MNRRIKNLFKLFIFILLFTFFFGMQNVFATSHTIHEIELKRVPCKNGKCLRNTNRVPTKYNKKDYEYGSVQSMVITDDAFVVVYTLKDENDEEVKNMFYVINKKTYDVDTFERTNACSHANGLTYNPDKGPNGVVVCAASSMNAFVEYDAKTFTKKNTYISDKSYGNIAYDRATKTYWTANKNGNGMYQFDQNFNLLKKIPKSSLDVYGYDNSDGVTLPYHFNQDSVIHNGHIYLITAPFNGVEGFSKAFSGMMKSDAVFFTYDLSTGKKTGLVYNRKTKRGGVDISEIEDMDFDGETPYLMFQKKGTFEIFTVVKKQNVNAKVSAKVKTNNDDGFKKLGMKATFKNTDGKSNINNTVEYSNGYTLSKINLTKAGTYKLEIKQGKTSDKKWTIDSKKINATIKVKCGLNLDNLSYKVSYASGDNTFNNTYDNEAIEVPISVKVATTKPSEYDITSSAELYNENNKKLDTVKESSGKYTFKKLSIKNPGTYKYTIKQKNAGKSTSGVYTKNIDSSTITVTVKVTSSNGKLSYKTSYSKNSFTNKVTAKYNKVTQNVEVKIKTNKNDSSIPTPTTKLNVYKGTKQVKTVNSASDKYSFGIDVTSPGTYKYTLKQDTSITGSGIYSYVLDNTTINLTIVAKVTNNQLTTTKTLSAKTYTNKVNVNYNEISVPIQVQIENNAPAGVTFPTTKAVLSGEGIKETINSSTGYYSHTLRFKKAGTYTYTMKQKNVSSNDDDVEYDMDDSKITITVVVTNNNGTLTSNVTYSKNKFTNTATTNVDPINLTLSANIETNKVNTSVTTPSTTATLYKNGTQVKTATSAKSKYTFKNIEIAAAGTYTYTIKQNSVSLSDPNMRLTLDNNTITVTVKVTEGANGLTAKTTYSTRTFNNTLEYTYGNINVDIVYNIDETNPELKPAEPTASIYQDNTKISTSTASNNKYNFRLTYNTPGTYTYKVSQDNCGTRKTNNVVSSIDCDTKELIVTVKESNNSLTSNVTYKYNDTTFENTYVNSYDALNIPISVDINNIKYSPSVPIPTTNATISSINSEGELEAIETVQNTDNKYLFKEIEVIEPGTYSYVVTQNNSGKRKDGIYIYDISEAVIVIIVKVREENNQLVYEIDSDDLMFDNTIEIDYDPITIPLMVNVSDNNSSIEKTMVFASDKQVLEKKTFTNASTVSSTNISVKRTGEYVYYIYIQKPHVFTKNNTKVELDSSIITATVTVTANENNALSYSIVYGKGSSTQQTLYTLTNRYTTVSEEDSKEVTAPITIDINSNSDDMPSLPTTATLYENGVPIETVTNNNGRYYFESLDFKNVGTYSYKIRQQEYDDQSWSIDDEEIELEITVFETSEGTLDYSIEFANDVSSFTNNDDTILETQQDPDPTNEDIISVPDTGLFKDHFIELLGIIITILGISIFFKVIKKDSI